MNKENKLSALWLSLICIVLFTIQYFVPGFTELFLLNKEALNGEVWRFATAIFMHGSLIHLVFNLFALLLFGLILESIIKTRKFLTLFLISGIIANIISVFFYNSSLGASGAIFGIIGALAVMRPMMPVWAFSIPMPMFVAAILWAVADILGIFFPSTTANIAHLSGLLVGLIYGLFLRLKKNNKENSFSYKIEIPEEHMRAWERRYMSSG